MTRYVMEIDLGEHESAEEAARGADLPSHASWLIRPALPVIRTCGDCGYRGSLGDHGESACMHDDAPRNPEPPRFVRVDPFAAPPSWCPKREESP